MTKCWICGEIADSKEHKFKASDIKKSLGKKFEAFYITENDSHEFNSYKDDIIQFPKVICIDCNNNKTRKHDDAYDEFVLYAINNQQKILRNGFIDFTHVYGEEQWLEKKINLYRYYAKHAGCKVYTTNFQFDLTNISKFILGKDVCADFILKFELKQAIEILINYFNKIRKYSHLYNSDIIAYYAHKNLIFGGWSTNNYITANWITGAKISNEDYLKMYQEIEPIILTDCNFKIENENNDSISKQQFIKDIHFQYENGYNKTSENKMWFFENIINNN